MWFMLNQVSFFLQGLLVTVRPYRFRAQSYKIVPTSDASQSQIQVLLTDWLQIRGSHDSLLGLD